MSEGPLLQARDLSVTYHAGGRQHRPVRAVEDVHFDLRQGEVFSLVGESGSGKSTLGRALLNLLPPGTRVDGTVELEGRDLLRLPRRELRRLRGREIALVFQDPMTRLDPLMSVGNHFVETLRSHEQVGRREALRRAVETLDAVGIPPSRVNAYPFELSGGMRQRVMIALALVFRAKILIADEATTSLDVVVQAQILRLLRDLTERFGVTVLNITHNLGVVAEISDRMAVMYGGRIMETGPVQRIFDNPRHPYSEGLLRSTVHMDTRELVWIDGSPPDLADPPPGCPFADRCAWRRERCTQAFPAETALDDGRAVFCVAVEEGER